MTLLVLGIGNPWAADDGVGPEVVRRLQVGWQEEGGDSALVEFQTLSQPDLGLLDALAECDALIVVDAVVSGAAPGTVHREVWQPGAVDSRGVERASSHGFGVRELLEMAAALGRLPARVELWGIEIESTEPGEGFSAAVGEAIPGVVEQLLAVVQAEARRAGGS